METATEFHDCFLTEKRFEDKLNFPYGFYKSGDFTIEQAQLLELNGTAYAELASGMRQPEGKTEKEFVAFCQGKKAAQTIHERIWKRYRAKIISNLTAISFNHKRTSYQLDEE